MRKIVDLNLNGFPVLLHRTLKEDTTLGETSGLRKDIRGPRETSFGIKKAQKEK